MSTGASECAPSGSARLPWRLTVHRRTQTSGDLRRRRLKLTNRRRGREGVALGEQTDIYGEFRCRGCLAPTSAALCALYGIPLYPWAPETLLVTIAEGTSPLRVSVLATSTFLYPGERPKASIVVAISV
jgi:hypothetical protein